MYAPKKRASVKRASVRAPRTRDPVGAGLTKAEQVDLVQCLNRSFTQLDLAARYGVSQATISRWCTRYVQVVHRLRRPEA